MFANVTNDDWSRQICSKSICCLWPFLSFHCKPTRIRYWIQDSAFLPSAITSATMTRVCSLSGAIEPCVLSLFEMHHQRIHTASSWNHRTPRYNFLLVKMDPHRTEWVVDMLLHDFYFLNTLEVLHRYYGSLCPWDHILTCKQSFILIFITIYKLDSINIITVLFPLGWGLLHLGKCLRNV